MDMEQPTDTYKPETAPEPVNPNDIEALIKADLLEEALHRFEIFFNSCEERRIDLVQTQARLTGVNKLQNAQAIGPEGKIERNKIRMEAQTFLNTFRKEVLAKFFDIRGRADFLNQVTDRDSVIHEILDLQLLPKRYRRDETWKPKEGNTTIIYRLENVETQRHAIAQVFKIPKLEEAVKGIIKQLADLRHRNVIKLLDHEIDKFPYFVITEYVYGETLQHALKVVGPRPIAQVADWLYQLADSLDYLRHKRILHTNVRPSKIYIDDEWQIMITPFDLMQIASAGRSTETPAAEHPDAGKQPSPKPTANPYERTLDRYRDLCQYGSPELLECDGAGFDLEHMAISDLYSLGLVGYKMLTGEELFEGERISEILKSRRLYSESSPHRKQRLALLPDCELTRVLLRLLEPDPKKRAANYPNMHALLRALHLLTRIELPVASNTRASYRRCLANNREFFNDFYERYLRDSPHSAHFDAIKRKRQKTMLQMALDVLLDLDTRRQYLVDLMDVNKNAAHARYAYADFEAFLNALLQTVYENDPFCRDNPELAKEWESVRDEALKVIRQGKPG